MLVEPLALTTPISAFNGGLIVRPDMSVVEQRTIAQDVVPAAIELLGKQGLDVWLYSGADWLVRDPKAPHVDREASTVQFDPTVVEELRRGEGRGQDRGDLRRPRPVAAATDKAREKFGDHVSAASPSPITWTSPIPGRTRARW